MFDGQLVLSASALSTLAIEGIKWLVRYIKQDHTYSFPQVYYDLLVPFFSALTTILLGVAGFAEPVVFEWASLLQWFVTIVVTISLYHLGVKPSVESRISDKFGNG